MHRFCLASLILSVFSPLILTCNSTKRGEKGVEAAMNQYNHYIQAMNVDSIAWLFTSDGNLGNVAHGRDSIRNFLSKFNDFKVLSQMSTTKSIKIKADSALQEGVYNQTTIISKNDTVKVSGIFTATWVHFKNEWHLKRMLTKPAQ